MSSNWEAERQDAVEADRWARAHGMDADAYDRAVDANEARLRGLTGAPK